MIRVTHGERSALSAATVETGVEEMLSLMNSSPRRWPSVCKRCGRLAKLAKLKSLSLEATPISDEGLKNLQDLKNLERLNLTKTQVTEAGLAHLQELPKLKELVVGFTGISDAAREEFNKNRGEGKPRVQFSEAAR